MRRREFITLAGGAVAALPVAARAQQPERMRRIGVFMGYAEADPESQRRNAALLAGLSEAGWVPGHNLQIDYRWANADVDVIGQSAKELVALKPELILANTTPVVAALKRETSTIPIVFVIVSDPVGEGFISSLSRPAENITGFINNEESMGGKWLELLKEIAPAVTHAAMIFNPETAPRRGNYFLPSYEAAGLKLGVKTAAAPVQNPSDIERSIGAIAAEPGGGLAVMTDSFVTVHRQQIVALAATAKLPAIYPVDVFARDGGLIAYAPVYLDLFRRSASYVDRILRGEAAANLPVQVPTKFELVINLKTAAALGLRVPQTLLATADEVIE